MLNVFFAIVFAAAFALLALAVALGWTPDTTQRGRYSYPAGPDAEPWHTD
jgi:hypothetical protein